MRRWNATRVGTTLGWMAGLCLLAAPAGALTIASLDVPKAIPDDDAGGVVSTLTAPDLVLADVNLRLDEIRHTSVPDLRIQLTSPAGTTVTIVESFTNGGILSVAGTPDDFLATTIDDQAATNLRDGTAPYTGAFNVDHAPSGIASPLAAFVGENALGDWTLAISDLAAEDTGTLEGWSLAFTEVPEPGTALFVGLGLALLAAGRRP